MITVFIGGSRRISRLNSRIRQRLDRIIDDSVKVLVGDASGADRAVQTYLKSKNYNLVEVFCAGRTCRNNLGDWPVRRVAAGKLRGFDFYATKDLKMAEEAAYGFMIWDGNSMGTLMNALRLVDRNKIVVIYLSPTMEFFDLKSRDDLHNFIDTYASELKGQIEERSQSEMKNVAAQLSML
jgi:hypothetical protein